MKKLIAFSILLFVPSLALASGLINPTDSVINTLAQSTVTFSSNLQSIAIKLFFAFTLLQFTIIGYGQLAAGEIGEALAKFSKAFLWVCFCFFLMSNNFSSDLIGTTINFFLDSSIGWATGTPANFNVGGIMDMGFTAISNVTKAATMAALPTSLFNNLVAFALSGPMVVEDFLLVGLVTIIILLTCGYIALKVFMIKIEAVIVLAVLPLSLSFLGLNALRDQGFAPFKSMLALIYRIMILGMVVGMVSGIGLAILAIAKSPSAADGIYVPLLSTAFGYVIAAFLAHKSDSIATSLANGSASLGSGDAVGGVMAAAAVASGVGAAAGAAAGGKSMGEVMKSMVSGGGSSSVSNASGTGSGGIPKAAEPAPQKPNASLKDGGQGSGAPKRPEAAATAANTSGSASAPEAAPEASGGAAAANTSSNSASAPGAAPEASGGTAAANTSSNSAFAPGAVPEASGGTAAANTSSNSASAPGAARDASGAPATVNTSSGSPPAPNADTASLVAFPDNGSGVTAGIGEAGGDMAKKLDQILANQAPKRPTATDHLKKAGDHLAQPGPATHVSINTNAE